jgi:MFS family permease
MVSEPTHPLQIRDYRLVWLTRFFSVNAMNAVVVVIGAQVYQLARTKYGMPQADAAFLLGLLGLAQFIPFMLLTPVAGLIADRVDRRHIAATASGIDLSICLGLGAANATGNLTLPLLFALAALHGVARVFIGPSISATMPNIVPANLLPRAIAISSIAWQSGAVIGPAMGGFLLAADPALPYWYGAGLLLIGIGMMLSIRAVPLPNVNTDLHPLRQIAEGAQFVWRERFLLGCVTLDLFAVLLGGATAMLPVFAYDVGDEGLGLLRGAPALGAAVVALWLGFRPLKHNVGAKMLWAVIVFGGATVVFGLSHSFLLSLVALVVLGAADGISVFIRGSLVQLNTPDEMRGRVSSISGLAISASNELGEMQSGLAAAAIGAVGAVVAGGVGAIAVTVLWTWLFPELRNARTFAPHYRQQKDPVP